MWMRKKNITPKNLNCLKNDGAGRRRRKQPERDKVRRPCVKIWRDCKKQNLFKRYDYVQGFFTIDQGLLTPIQKSNAKKDGYEAGVYDFYVIAASKDIMKVWLIEFKYDTNDYTTEQAEVAEGFEDTPVTCLKIYNPGQFTDFLKENLF